MSICEWIKQQREPERPKQKPDVVDKVGSEFTDIPQSKAKIVTPLEDYLAPFPQEMYDARSVWCPFTEKYRPGEAKYRWTYPKGYMMGFIWHFTAGHWRAEKQVYRSMDFCISGTKLKSGKRHYNTYDVIGVNGKHLQSTSYKKGGYHGGPCYHPLVGRAVSTNLLGIEFNNPGHLSYKGGAFYTWFGAKLTEAEADRVIHVKKMTGNIFPNYYLPFSDDQMRAGIKFARWAKWNHPTVFNYNLVVGHDEVHRKKWKTDPGGCLFHLPNDDKPMTTDELREYLNGLKN